MGDGKGKTTSALGLGLRAAGRGLKVIMFQFHKGAHSGELESTTLLEGRFKIVRLAVQMPVSTICSTGITAVLTSFAADQLTRTIKTGWKGWPNTLSGPRFLKERMVYVLSSEAADGLPRVIYQAKDSSSSKTFLALYWLARLVSHIPGKGEQMVR